MAKEDSNMESIFHRLARHVFLCAVSEVRASERDMQRNRIYGPKVYRQKAHHVQQRDTNSAC